jgi:hypothetical protein
MFSYRQHFLQHALRIEESSLLSPSLREGEDQTAGKDQTAGEEQTEIEDV